VQELEAQRTYAYYLVDHLRWLEREGLTVERVIPLGEPWRVGKRPYGKDALSMTAARELFVNTMPVSGAIVLSASRPTFAKLAADPGDAALELAGVGAGVLIA
jgi:hypothetical protein